MVLAEAMAPAGVELIVAAHDDGVVPALVLGLGGIWTELLDDVVVVPLPADARASSARCARCAARRCCSARAGGAAVDLDGGGAARRAGRRAAVGRRAALVECNPVLAGPGGAVAADAAVAVVAATVRTEASTT